MATGGAPRTLLLKNVQVLDLSRLLPGPYATQLLVDLGAQVTKLENSETGGDPLRHSEPLCADGNGAMFHALNRGKRSVALPWEKTATAESGSTQSHHTAHGSPAHEHARRRRPSPSQHGSASPPSRRQSSTNSSAQISPDRSPNSASKIVVRFRAISAAAIDETGLRPSLSRATFANSRFVCSAAQISSSDNVPLPSMSI